MTQFYLYLFCMLLVATALTMRTKTAYPIELFIVCFFLLSGNLNELFTINIPGISFFEIQPERLLLIIFGILVARKLIFQKRFGHDQKSLQLPWFIVFLNLFVISVIVSLLTHMYQFSSGELVVAITKPLNFFLIVYGVTIMMNRASIDTVGKAIIIGAVFSSVISLIQVGIEPTFLRYGEFRPAFGEVLRSNGIFNTERTNGFFLLTALAWVMVFLKERKLVKNILICLFIAAIATTFHRMSWIMAFLVLVAYLIKVEKIGFDRLTLGALASLILIVAVSIFSLEDIKKSAVVSERLSEVPTQRKGYYTMVIRTIGDKPIFGYGGKNNETYYTWMLKITGRLQRATGEEGGIHSGYFSTMFYYGIPSFIFFTGFIVLSISYFRSASRYHVFFLIPLLVATLYAIGNLTNTVLFKTGGILFMIHIGLGLTAIKMKEFYPGDKQTSINTSIYSAT